MINVWSIDACCLAIDGRACIPFNGSMPFNGGSGRHCRSSYDDDDDDGRGMAGIGMVAAPRKRWLAYFFFTALRLFFSPRRMTAVMSYYWGRGRGGNI